MAVEPQPATKLGVSAGALEKLDWRAKPERAARDEQVRVETAVRRVMDASDGTADRTQREELFQLYLRLVSDVQASIVKSVEKRRQSRIWGRALVAASSLAAALAGLGLALNYHGF